MKPGRTGDMDSFKLLRYGFLFAVIAICFTFGVRAAAEPPETAKDVLLGDFEEKLPEGFEALRAEAELKSSSEDAASGSGYLEVIVPEERKHPSQLCFKLPEGVDLSYYKSLKASMWLNPKADSWKFRWQIVNKNDEQIYQRMFEVKGAEGWKESEWPLSVWRWSNSKIADWSEGTKLILNIEAGDGEVRLDDIRFVPGERGAQSAMPEPDWIAKVAFTGEFRSLNKEGFFIATDALDELSKEDLPKILEKIAPVREWLKATFKTARRPVCGESPVSLLIFKEMDGYKSFYERLGDAWNVSIGAPGAGGYTVQDISASTYSDRYGADRPVYFHELVHAVVSRELRLLPGQRRHSWLQEGLANYLQLCLYPESLPRDAFVKNFSQRITNRSFFKPLRQVLTGNITTREYAQLASLTAFLVDEHPDWLDKIALGIADTRDLEDVLKEDLEMTYEDFQEKWLEWGKRTFATDSEPPEGPGTHFKTPTQWKKAGKQEEPSEEGNSGEEGAGKDGGESNPPKAQEF
jgi:hypothetical protein